MLDTANEPTTEPRQASALRPAVILGAVLTLVYGVLLLCDLSVPQPTDNTHYMDAALKFPSVPTSPLIVHQYLRIGLTAPTVPRSERMGQRIAPLCRFGSHQAEHHLSTPPAPFIPWSLADIQSPVCQL